MHRTFYITPGHTPRACLFSDAATMQIIRWTKGGFGMAAHNYDGDMLTDEVAQVRGRCLDPSLAPSEALSRPLSSPYLAAT